MITEAFIKGRFDFGKGKCAVVIVEEGEIVNQHSWAAPPTWQYDGVNIPCDQFNCEILAACYAAKWCLDNGRNALNIYANTTSCQKWYYRRDFPEERMMGKAFNDSAIGLDVFSEYVPKSDDGEFNQLVNELAMNVIA